MTRRGGAGERGFEALRFGAYDWRRLTRSVSLYAASAIACVALFFFLHYIGNGISYKLAAQRFAAAIEFNERREGYWNLYEYCEFSFMTLGGADDPGVDRGHSARRRPGAGEAHALRDALIPLIAKPMPMISFHEPCRIDIAEDGSQTRDILHSARYWWGGKAIYAIALRALSVREIHLLTLWLAGAAWIALAAVLAATNRKALLILLPLIVFGALLSETLISLNAANGLPYLWAVASAAALAWLIRTRPLAPRALAAARLFCFIAGMVSAYLWLSESHQILAATLIGMLGYFGQRGDSAKESAKFAGSCVALYMVGFAASWGLGLGVRIAAAAFSGSPTFILDNFFEIVRGNLDQTAVQTVGDADTPGYPIIKYFPLFYEAALRRVEFAGGQAARTALMGLSGALLLGAAWLAWIRARQGRTRLRSDMLWIAGMAALAAPQFMLPEDFPFRRSVYVFIFYGLCASCLILALLDLDAARRARAHHPKYPSPYKSSVLRHARARLSVPSALLRRLPSAAVLRRAGCGCALIGIAAAFYLFSIPEKRLIDRISELGDPVVQARFEVYWDKGNSKLIYFKRDCNDRDIFARFILRLYPYDVSVLRDGIERDLGRSNRDFWLYKQYRVRTAAYCAAEIDMPDYDVGKIRTGQFISVARRLKVWDMRLENDLALWAGNGRLDWADDIGERAAASVFDLHLNESEGALTYIKEPCSQADADARFFLHVTPANPFNIPFSLMTPDSDNLDFDFADEFGEIRDGKCRVQQRLPDYRIARIKTGQFADDGKIWEEVLDIGGSR